MADPSDEAYDRAVDDLLMSPQYVERWGRHSMDVWRYSDWYGQRQFNLLPRSASACHWRWRRLHSTWRARRTQVWHAPYYSRSFVAELGKRRDDRFVSLTRCDGAMVFDRGVRR
ncbi:MAG: DUF1549 domain-containing protein [Planctomycetales bacterium]|nr:DUF1549 domain-containing protein [Planctomycetales bacterium]